MSPRKLVLFVEGEGDKKAVRLLVRHLLNELAAWDCLSLDDDVFAVGEVGNLMERKEENLKRYIRAARKRKSLGGILLLLDGDVLSQRRPTLCAMNVGRNLARIAQSEGAGVVFSFAGVLAMQEFESWLIGGIEALAGKALPDGRPGIQAKTAPPESDLEIAPRGAKEWLGRCMENGYKSNDDQAPLTQLLIANLQPLRRRQLRSFRRLENAMRQLVDAFRSGQHIATPAE